MRFDFNLLNNIEQLKLSILIKQYRDYDKLDILIERVVEDVEDFKKRKRPKKKKIEVKVQKMDESLKFCDGDKCSIPLQTSC